jgi:alkanesulfonate monooxygenase SsuD/methylene tetrahydromethanopterin reductase-like flavin-dependent oxidoreductase (luciferase family)
VAVEFGLGILTGQVPPGAAVRVADEYRTTVSLAERAEACGFRSVWLSEHHFAADSYFPSVLPLLATIGGRTADIELGAATILAPFHNPIRLAEDAAVVDLLSGGRIRNRALAPRSPAARGGRHLATGVDVSTDQPWGPGTPERP